MKILGYEVHPAAALFPLMQGTEFAALVEDIRAHGLIHPVLLCDGLVLDGRNRLRACEKAGVEPRTIQAKIGSNPWDAAWSENAERRHLEAGQKTAIKLLCLRGSEKWSAAREQVKRKADEARSSARAQQRRAEKQGVGSPCRVQRCTRHGPKPEHAKAALATAAGTSPRTAQAVLTLEKKSPERFEKVAKGELTLPGAFRELKEQERENKRQDNAVVVAAAPNPETLVGKQAFSTIVIDPPWDWGDEGDQDQLGRARPTYQTIPAEDLPKLPVAALAAPNAHIYLWITNRSLPKGFALLEAWGFRYVTMLTWCKPSFGMGNYFRGSTEQILFGVRGSLPLKRKDVGTWFAWPRTDRHSGKPEESFALVESCSPGPYLEMYSRSGRTGWTAWGAEVNG